MNIIDSSGWIEYFGGGPNGAIFLEPARDVDRLLVPSLCIAEVFKVMEPRVGKWDALRMVAQMSVGHVVDLTKELALEAARLGLTEGLGLADSVILATARAHTATLWTQDADFEGMEGVQYVRKAT